MFYLRLKSFNLIKWRNNDVIIIENSYFGEFSLVVIRGHSCLLLDTTLIASLFRILSPSKRDSRYQERSCLHSWTVLTNSTHSKTLIMCAFSIES